MAAVLRVESGRHYCILCPSNTASHVSGLRWNRYKRNDMHARHEARRVYVQKLASVHDDPEYKARQRAAHIWQQRLHKWDLMQRLLGGSVDFATSQGVKRKDHLCLRVASYTGFFAKHFTDIPTPKQYFTANLALMFVENHGFCGYGDEEPMESQHADWNVHLNRYRHCRSKKLALRSFMRQTHVRNNLRIRRGHR